MGVTHSMDEEQVHSISSSLRGSSRAINGINDKLAEVDDHCRAVMDFNRKINDKVDGTLGSFEHLDDTVRVRVGMVLDTLTEATEDLKQAVEATVGALQQVDIGKEMNQLPKAVIPLMIPLILLLIELAVSNAYMGILLAGVQGVGDRYRSYLMMNAAAVLIGLTLSLLWLGGYRIWLSSEGRRQKVIRIIQNEFNDYPERASETNQSDFSPADPGEVGPGGSATPRHSLKVSQRLLVEGAAASRPPRQTSSGAQRQTSAGSLGEEPGEPGGPADRGLWSGERGTRSTDMWSRRQSHEDAWPPRKQSNASWSPGEERRSAGAELPEGPNHEGSTALRSSASTMSRIADVEERVRQRRIERRRQRDGGANASPALQPAEVREDQSTNPLDRLAPNQPDFNRLLSLGSVPSQGSAPGQGMVSERSSSPTNQLAADGAAGEGPREDPRDPSLGRAGSSRGRPWSAPEARSGSGERRGRTPMKVTKQWTWTNPLHVQVHFGTRPLGRDQA